MKSISESIVTTIAQDPRLKCTNIITSAPRPRPPTNFPIITPPNPLLNQANILHSAPLLPSVPRPNPPPLVATSCPSIWRGWLQWTKMGASIWLQWPPHVQGTCWQGLPPRWQLLLPPTPLSNKTLSLTSPYYSDTWHIYSTQGGGGTGR